MRGCLGFVGESSLFGGHPPLEKLWLIHMAMAQNPVPPAIPISTNTGSKMGDENSPTNQNGDPQTVLTTTAICLWLKIKQEGLRRFWSMFLITRVPSWYQFFEPQPYGVNTVMVVAIGFQRKSRPAFRL